MNVDDPNAVRRANREALRARKRATISISSTASYFPPWRPRRPSPTLRIIGCWPARLKKSVRARPVGPLIAIPPRHGKSILASVALPAWILGRDPKRKLICACPLAKDCRRTSPIASAI